MEVLEAIHTLRAMRRLKPDPVPDGALRTMLEAAIRGPSGTNQQNWAFIVVRDQAIKDTIGRLYREAWETLNASGYATSVAGRYLAEHIGEAPVWIFACIRVPDGGGALATGASIYPSVQNLMLAARDLGIGTTLTTVYKRFDKEVNELLGLPEGWDTAALIPVGYPRGKWGAGPRRPLEEVAFSERFGRPLYPL